jgi:hypothetical protein
MTDAEDTGCRVLTNLMLDTEPQTGRGWDPESPNGQSQKDAPKNFSNSKPPSLGLEK